MHIVRKISFKGNLHGRYFKTQCMKPKCFTNKLEMKGFPLRLLPYIVRWKSLRWKWIRNKSSAERLQIQWPTYEWSSVVPLTTCLYNQVFPILPDSPLSKSKPEWASNMIHVRTKESSLVDVNMSYPRFTSHSLCPVSQITATITSLTSRAHK